MSATTLLIILNIGVFLLQSAFSRNPSFLRMFALSVDGIFHGHIWQLLTYQFLHGGLLHIMLNCWGIFLFGRHVEMVLGRRQFWILYLLSGVAGGILQVIATLTWKAQFGGIVVGASAGLFGLIAAYATMFPHAEIMLIFPPVVLRAKTLLMIAGAMAVFGILFPQLLAVLGLGRHIAHAAHLGGMLAGMMFIRRLRFKLGYWPGETPRPRRRPLFGFGPGKPSKPGGTTIINVQEVDEDEYVAREVDPILEKISQQGIHSLTARERKVLEEARKKMRKS